MENFNTLPGEYQHYLLMLNELAKDKNEMVMNDYLEWLALSGDEPLDLLQADQSPANLAKLDFAVFQQRKNELAVIAPEIKNIVDEKILSFNPLTPLYDAGFDDTQIGRMPVGFLQDIQTTMAFEDEFPDEERIPLSERLSNAKDSILSLMKGDATKLAMSTVMFSITVGTGGGAALAISSIMFATKLAENKLVQSLLTKTEQRIDKFLIDKGFKQEVVEQRKQTFGEKLEALTESNWYKKLKLPVAACLLLTGVGTAAALSMSHFGVEGVSSLIDKGSEFVSNASDAASSLLEQGQESISAALGGGVDPASVTAGGYDGAFSAAAYDDVLNPGVDNVQVAQVQDLVSLPIEEDPSRSAFDSIFTGGEHVTQFGELANVGPSDVFVADNSPTDMSFDVLNGNATGTFGTVDASMDPLSFDVTLPDVTQYTAHDGSTLWDMAREHYEHINGHAPTGTQITAMINDLGLEDPNQLQIGQQFEFSNDLTKYEHLDKVTADWLGGGTHKAAEVVTAHVDAAAPPVQTVGTHAPAASSEPFVRDLDAARTFADKFADRSPIPSR